MVDQVGTLASYSKGSRRSAQVLANLWSYAWREFQPPRRQQGLPYILQRQTPVLGVRHQVPELGNELPVAPVSRFFRPPPQSSSPRVSKQDPAAGPDTFFREDPVDSLQLEDRVYVAPAVVVLAPDSQLPSLARREPLE